MIQSFFRFQGLFMDIRVYLISGRLCLNRLHGFCFFPGFYFFPGFCFCPLFSLYLFFRSYPEFLRKKDGII